MLGMHGCQAYAEIGVNLPLTKQRHNGDVLFLTLTKCTLNLTHHLIVRNRFSRLVIHYHLRLFIDFLRNKDRIVMARRHNETPVSSKLQGYALANNIYQ